MPSDYRPPPNQPCDGEARFRRRVESRAFNPQAILARPTETHIIILSVATQRLESIAMPLPKGLDSGAAKTAFIKILWLPRLVKTIFAACACDQWRIFVRHQRVLSDRCEVYMYLWNDARYK